MEKDGKIVQEEGIYRGIQARGCTKKPLRGCRGKSGFRGQGIAFSPETFETKTPTSGPDSRNIRVSRT
jgi:hypothetical protein